MGSTTGRIRTTRSGERSPSQPRSTGRRRRTPGWPTSRAGDRAPPPARLPCAAPPPPDAPTRRVAARSAGEVGHDADLAAVLPDADARELEPGVLHVGPVAAVRGLLALHREMRRED